MPVFSGLATPPLSLQHPQGSQNPVVGGKRRKGKKEGQDALCSLLGRDIGRSSLGCGLHDRQLAGRSGGDHLAFDRIVDLGRHVLSSESERQRE